MEQKPDSTYFTTKCFEQAQSFLTYLANGDRAYHNHKENMAYAGTALFVTGFIGALVSPNLWPLHLTNYHCLNSTLSLIFVVIAWFVFMVYLRFELRGRRWAAIRLAAAEDVLVFWSCRHPTVDDLEPESTNKTRDEEFLLFQFIWPSPSMSIDPDNNIMKVLPKSFAKALKERAEKGSPAVKHERLLLNLSSALSILLIIKLIIRIC